ncbi:MAG: FKBP-type peptidyl-prolyl cis-trans isomerase [Treponema sp.]|jgi:FKBP-type peptidyl-prolyl cis-trans isomerase|nr:FKBP-type peptidyl-prolyl cis-trans isomerase [Treponema sp.]
MKHILPLTLLAVCLAAFLGCNGKTTSGSSTAAAEETFNKDASYALGMNIGSSLKMDEIHPNMDEFLKGINDSLNNSNLRFTQEQAQQILQETFTTMMEQRDSGKKQEEIDYLAENSKKPGISITASGLQYEVITEGSGPKPSAADTVRVQYEGTLTNGTVFDSSYSRGEPAEFPLGGVIPGWTEGLQLMNTGSKYRFYIPSDIGYGAQGAGQMIPPYATLIFEVELLSIIR